jgi:glycosyltransferase involved in cell wall biosynthesis
MSPPRPFLSVIVPAHQAAAILPKSLGALRASGLPADSWELIVVDDASTDDTALVASQYADAVVRLAGKPHGPAYARNRGCESSRGEVLVFVDADVVVHRESLQRFAVLFAHEPDLASVFGSYDTYPAARGLVSQYRNLLHHYVHQEGAGQAETFWAGLGAVRRSIFIELGMFDEWHYSRPQIEDIELGRRLRSHGHRILLRPEIQATHLKRWTLRDMVHTDIAHRGIPWMWLMLREGAGDGAKTLNVRAVHRWCTALVGLAGLLLVAALAFRNAWPLVGIPVAAIGVLLLNLGFYRFLRRHRSVWFAVAVVPLHLLYYAGNVLSVPFGWLQNVLFGEPQPSAETQAFAQLGVKTWPPTPSEPTTSVWNPNNHRSGTDDRPPAS